MTNNFGRPDARSLETELAHAGASVQNHRNSLRRGAHDKVHLTGIDVSWSDTWVDACDGQTLSPAQNNMRSSPHSLAKGATATSIRHTLQRGIHTVLVLPTLVC